MTKKTKKVLSSLWMLMGLMTGMMFSAVVLEHNYKWYFILLFMIGVLYSIWYLIDLFKQYKISKINK
jgi:uncharacterized membrane protein YqjE